MKQILEHPRNEKIEFDAASHTYTYCGDRNFEGITSWIDDFHPKFNAEAVLDKYYKIWQWQKDDRYYGMSREEIKEQWSEKGRSATEYGNYVHEAIDNYITLGVDFDLKELDNFKAAMEEKNLTPVCCEWVVYDEEIERASAVDLVCVNEDDEIVIVDIKTMEDEIEKKAYKDKTFYFPIANVPDSKYHKQCLQVSIYRKWLSELYDLELADEHYILRLRDNLYEFIETEDLTAEINLLYKTLNYENKN